MGKFVLKRVLFSGDENKIKTYDKLRIAANKVAATRGMKENYRDLYEEAAKNGKVSDETVKKVARRDSLELGAGAALGGTAAGGYLASKMYKPLKGKYKAAALAGGAIGGLGLGTAVGAVLGAGNYLSETTLGKATVNKFAKDKKNREKYQKEADIMKVSLGEMSKGEFAKRWGEKKFSSKPQKD